MGIAHLFRLGRSADKLPSVTQVPHWDVRGLDFYRVFAALPRLLPTGSVLALAKGAWPKRLRSFIADHGVAVDPSLRDSLPRDFSAAALLPVDEVTMVRLTEIANDLAEPEVAIHLAAAHGRQVLLEWYDAPHDPLAISSDLGEAAIRYFTAAVGGECALSGGGA